LRACDHQLGEPHLGALHGRSRRVRRRRDQRELDAAGTEHDHVDQHADSALPSADVDEAAELMINLFWRGLRGAPADKDTPAVASN